MNTVQPGRLACIAGAFTLALPLLSVAIAPVDRSLSLDGYQREDGAITLKRDTAFVDPYFATKALLLAVQHGLDMREITQKWIAWLLPRQLPDGRFMRYCRYELAAQWLACKDADADDAMMAMWVALLAEATPGEMPVALQNSMDRALTRLESLRVADGVTGTGVYTISSTNSAALLMDNVEIYEGYSALSRYFAAHGPLWRAKAYTVRAMAVADAIERVFWDPVSERYRITTQVRQSDDFYPDQVAQLYPLLGGLPDICGERRSSRSSYHAWMARNKAPWLTLTADYFPWGLVAIAALHMDDKPTALSWVESASGLRAGPRWNVLEEVTYVILRPSSWCLERSLC
ncbi:hypothetical protein ACVBEF_04200 [Glaciimonas sp. GG7]